MRKLMLAVLMAAATTVWAQQLDFKVLDKLASKAKSTTEMGMDADDLKATTATLNENNKEEAAVKKTVQGMNGFFMRSYEFEKGQFQLDDIKPLMDQLKAPAWKVFLRNKEDNEQTEIWWHITDGKPDGMLMIAAEVGDSPELTIINAMGTTNLGDLSQLKNLGDLVDTK